MNFDLSDLSAVQAIARKGSFRAAALEMGMSPTRLSNVIGKLELQLGVRLFNRTTRSVSLTDAGRRFVDQVSPALADVHRALDTVRSQQETPMGTLRINTFAAAAREVMSPLIFEYMRRYPSVQIDIVTEGNRIDIVAAGYDFGVRSRPLVPADMIAIPLGPERRNVVVASPGYLAERGCPRVPSDLLAHPCVRARLPNGAILRWHLEADGRPLQIDVDGPMTLDEASLARLAVLQSIGIGYFMESDVAEDITSGRLVRILDDYTPQLAPLCLYYPNRRNPPAAFKAFVDLAREISRKRAD